MKRRDFLGAGAAGASLLALDLAPSRAQNNAGQNNAPISPFVPPKRSPLYKDGDWRQPLRALRGVNLGGWLVLERWMMPSLFENTKAHDEYTMSMIPGGRERIEHHRETWITEADFRWMAEYGLDAVRLPIGYWTLQEAAPYVGGAKHLQNAFDWAAKYDLKILLDLHGAQGSQNGGQMSGRAGERHWEEPENRAASLQTLVQLADKYGAHPQLWGLELLNEPGKKVPRDILRQFYLDAYRVLRPKLPAHVAFVIHDGFRLGDWEGFAPAGTLSNVILDTHMYQTYTKEDRSHTSVQHVQTALNRVQEIDRLKSSLPLIVGEWSLGLPWNYMKDKIKTPLEQDAARLGFAGAQLLAFENTRGWFFWSYKTETRADWSFRDSVKNGWLPASMAIT